MISWAALGVGLAAVGVTQTFEPEAFGADYLRQYLPGERSNAALGAHAQGQVTFFSPFGVYGRASTWAWADSPGFDAHLAGIGSWRALTMGAGVGTSSVDLFQGPQEPVVVVVDEEQVTLDEEHELFFPRYALGLVHLRGGRSWRWHTGLTLGGSRGAQRGLVELHVASRRDGSGRWRVGGTMEWTRAELDDPNSRLRVTSGSVRAGLHLGRTFGEY